jgi:hypothetical protein
MRHENALAAVLANKKGAKPAVTSPNYSGLWQNEYLSTVNFVVNGPSVSGTYTSAVSGGGTPVSGPIVGCLSGDTIAFSVIWPTKQASITSWVGQAVTGPLGTPVLETLWYLVSDISEDPSQVWTSVYAGADIFTPAPINKS